MVEDEGVALTSLHPWLGGCKAADFIMAWGFVQLKNRRGR